jgi:tetratricopeptide (TPR) repeat protein
MTIEDLRAATTADACAAALDELLAAETDPTNRLVLLFEASMAYLRLKALTEAEETIARIARQDGDVVNAGDDDPSLKEAAFTNLAKIRLSGGRVPEAVTAIADAARAAAAAERPIRALKLIAAALEQIPEIGPDAAATLTAPLDRAADAAPRGAELFNLLFEIGHAAYQRGDAQQALRLQERALSLSSFAEDEAVARVLCNLVVIAAEVQDYRRVSRHGRRAAAAARAANLATPSALLGYTVGAEAELGRSTEALELLGEIERELPAEVVEYSRAQLLMDLKRYDEASRVLDGATFQAAERLRRQLAQETSGPLSIDCAHRVLGMVLGLQGHEISHEHDMPADVFDPDAYVVPDLTDADREHFDRLLAEFEEPYLQTRWGEPTPETPAPYQHGIHIEYVADVADFEQRWHLYARERQVRARRRELHDHWEAFRARHPITQDVARSDVAEIIQARATLAGISRELALAREREAFAQVALYAADLLEAWHDDPFPAALAWSQRAEVIAAARLFADDRVTVLPVELARCVRQFGAVLAELDADRGATALDMTLEQWIDIAEDEGTGIDAAALAHLALPFVPVAESYTRMLVGVACSLAGRHEKAGELIENVVAEARAAEPDTPVIYPEHVGVARAVARMAARAPSAEACAEHYGPFAPVLHEEVAGWAPDALPYTILRDECAPLAYVPPLAFADPPLVVMHQALGDATTVVMMHEIAHLSLRVGQVLRAQDGRWLRVRRDVPVASAIAYEGLLNDAEPADLTALGLDGVGALVAAGERAAQRDAARSGSHIQNMLEYFDALGRQETPASYECGALLAGMARGLLQQQAIDYLHHLAVLDHDEALVFGAQGAELRL